MAGLDLAEWTYATVVILVMTRLVWKARLRYTRTSELIGSSFTRRPTQLKHALPHVLATADTQAVSSLHPRVSAPNNKQLCRNTDSLVLHDDRKRRLRHGHRDPVKRSLRALRDTMSWLPNLDVPANPIYKRCILSFFVTEAILYRYP